MWFSLKSGLILGGGLFKTKHVPMLYLRIKKRKLRNGFLMNCGCLNLFSMMRAVERARMVSFQSCLLVMYAAFGLGSCGIVSAADAVDGGVDLVRNPGVVRLHLEKDLSGLLEKIVVKVDGEPVIPRKDRQLGLLELDLYIKGDRTITVEHEDCLAWEHKVRVEGSDHQDLAYVPSLWPSRVKMVVQSLESRATLEEGEFEVFVDGTPVEIRGGWARIPAMRKVNLTIRARGYEDWSHTIRAQPRSVDSLQIMLRPIIGPKPGSAFSINIGNRQSIELEWVPSMGAWVGKYEVSLGEFRRFRPGHMSDGIDDPDRFPVVGVSLEDALAFVDWVNRTYGGQYAGWRLGLPSVQEWMVYSRCGDSRNYPWGNQWPPLFGNLADLVIGESKAGAAHISGYQDGFAGLAMVEESGVNEWGIFGISGNASEWVLSAANGLGEARGGHYEDALETELRCDYSKPIAATTRDSRIGFRVLLTRGNR